MKNRFIIPILILAISLSAFRTKSPEWFPPYRITESKADPNLKKTEAVFEITFLGSYANLISDSIRLSCNEKNTKVKPDAKGKTVLNVKPGKFKFQFYYNSRHFEIATDSIEIKPGFRSEMTVHFESSDYPVKAEKPVIYIYPEKTQEVDIKLNLKGELGFTYPEYENGWSVTADPDGTIHQNGKEYDYLFWDGELKLNFSQINLNEGFVLHRDSLVPFFEKNLSAMGLNPRETEDYITYWVPRMQANEFSYVHFLFNETYSEYASMTVNPKPDQLFRVYMIWGKADANQIVKEQKMESFSRNGFTVVEWGGTEVSEFPFAAR